MYYCTVQQYSSALCTQYTLAVLYVASYCTTVLLRYSTVALQYITYTIGTFVTPWSFAAKERRGRGGVSLTVITVSGPIF